MGHAIDLCHVGADPHGLRAAAVERHAMQEAVRVLEAVDDEALAAAYRGAVALTIASVAEGFCLPILEAQGLGVPVCSTKCGALAEIAGDAALYFQADRPSELAAHVATLLEDEERRAAIIAAGYRNAGRFDWDRTAVAVLNHALATTATGKHHA